MSNFCEDWKKVTFESVFKNRKQKSNINQELLSVTVTKGVVRRNTLERRDTSNLDKGKYLLVKRGDIAYNTMRMWQGVSGVSPFEGIVSPAYTVCIPKSNLDSTFAGYLLKNPEMILKFRKYSQGLVSDTWNLKFEQFSKISFYLPPLMEQKKIANILSRTDSLINLYERKLEKVKFLYKALIQKFMIQGIENENISDTKLGKLPQSWKVLPLGSLGKFYKGKGISKNDLSSYGVPVIRYAEIYTDYEYTIKKILSI